MDQGKGNQTRSSVAGRVTRNRSHYSEGTNEPGKNSCPICFNDLTDIIAYQPCTHVLCFECSVRNRVLCNKKECPVCRTEAVEVVLAGHRHHSGELVDNEQRFRSVLQAAQNQGKKDPFYGFLFENIGIERSYRKLLTHSCRYCDRPFGEFDELVKHVRDRHDHHYCSVCVRTLMLFTWEHKLYMYDELLKHQEEGDPNDKERIPPHPQCQLCHFRGFDKDDLFKHSKQRHHLCWICDQKENKIMFFNTFPDLFSHMVDHHYVCKLCSNPQEARVSSFHDQRGLEIHIAAEHSADGTIRADMLFNFEQRGGRNNRRTDDFNEDSENVRPRSPVFQTFNMDASQFPVLGPGDGPSGHQSGPQSTAAIGRTVSDLTSRSLKSNVSESKPVPTFALPKMTENDFPSLGGPSSGKAPTVTGSSWNGNGLKTQVLAPVKSITRTPKKAVQPAAAGSAPVLAQMDNFPALSGPAPAAVAKLNRDWIQVPVKAKTSTKSTAVSKPVATTPNSRWDLPEPSQSPPKHRKATTSERTTEPVSSTPKGFVEHNKPETTNGFQEPVDFGADTFPSLAPTAARTLPTWFVSQSTKKKPAKAAPAKPVVKPPKAKAKSEKDELAQILFKSSTVLTRESSEEHDVVDSGNSVQHTLAATVTRAAPYAMKTDDFPSLEGKKQQPPIRMPADKKLDRVKKQTEVKTQWGSTLIQYETIYTYIPPPNGSERVVALHAKVEPVDLKGTSKTLSSFEKELLEEKISALEFWMECQRILGKKFVALMPEVVALLPNLQVQQEVFEVAKVPIYGNQAVVKALVGCNVCNQVLKVGEEKGHEKVHLLSR